MHVNVVVMIGMLNPEIGGSDRFVRVLSSVGGAPGSAARGIMHTGPAMMCIYACTRLPAEEAEA